MNLFREKAFTLSELMVSALILALILVSIVVVLTNINLLNEANRNLTIAVTHAGFLIEEIKNASFTGLESAIDSDVWDFTSAQLSATYGLSGLNNESVDTKVEQSGDPLEISVAVNWTDISQRNRSITLSTLRTN
ncbi:MAG: type II secretion system protein [bacterium]